MKVGIIGTGIFARDSHVPAFKKVGSIQPVACFNRTKSKAVAFAAGAGIQPENVVDSIDELIASDIDAVDALVPIDNNLSIVKKVLAANKPLAMEKPIAADLSDAREIVKLAKNSEQPVLILENWIYHHSTLKLKELLGKIGEVITFTYQSTGPFAIHKYHATPWRQEPKHPGGYISDGGVHEVALLTQILGHVESVSGHTVQVQPESGDIDTLSSLMKMESGAFGTFVYARSLGAAPYTLKFEIFGKEGSLCLNSSRDGSEILVSLGKTAAESKQETIKLPANDIDGVVAEFENFVEAVEKKDKSLLKSTPEEAFHHLAVIVAAIESKGECTKVEKL